MSTDNPSPMTFEFFGLPIVVEQSEAQLTSDAGLLPIREFDERIGLSQAFADILNDPRNPDSITHTMHEMVRSRVYGILAGYEDQNDHDTLRDDPVFKMVAGRSPTDAALASQPTLSRFENQIDIPSLKRLRDVFIDQFLFSYIVPPGRVVIDMDAVDDPAHGEQQLTLFHGYYDQTQYLPLVITCGDNDQFVMLSLRPGNVSAALGAADDLKYLVDRMRAVWPDTEIVVRADSGFGVPTMFDVCEKNELTYTFGLRANKVLQKASDALLAQAVEQFEKTGEPQRLFDGFWYKAKDWPLYRWVVVKAEANAMGTNRRFVVTNRPGAPILPQATYDEYADRGESENRNKEFKCGLAMDRMSDHRFMANYFRLYLHALAMNLLIRLRRHIADPPPVEELPLSIVGKPSTAGTAAETKDALVQAMQAEDESAPSPADGASMTQHLEQAPAASQPDNDSPNRDLEDGAGTRNNSSSPKSQDDAGTSSAPSTSEDVETLPIEALTGEQRRRYFRFRRQRDPLGEGHPCTWRTLLIKAAAEIIVTTRRVVVRLSSSWPHLKHYRSVVEKLRRPLNLQPG